MTPAGLKVSLLTGDLALLVFDVPCEDRAGRLTPAERAVVLLVLDGHSNADIGAMRGTSARTVANQVARILAKLGLHSRAELAARQPFFQG
jgi:DNA-binding CsgD family transcriptional regulator